MSGIALFLIAITALINTIRCYELGIKANKLEEELLILRFQLQNEIKDIRWTMRRETDGDQ